MEAPIGVREASGSVRASLGKFLKLGPENQASLRKSRRGKGTAVFVKAFLGLVFEQVVEYSDPSF